MAIYEESANIILEQELNQSGISKEDLKNPEKVKSIISKPEEDDDVKPFPIK